MHLLMGALHTYLERIKCGIQSALLPCNQAELFQPIQGSRDGASVQPGIGTETRQGRKALMGLVGAISQNKQEELAGGRCHLPDGPIDIGVHMVHPQKRRFRSCLSAKRGRQSTCPGIPCMCCQGVSANTGRGPFFLMLHTKRFGILLAIDTQGNIMASLYRKKGSANWYIKIHRPGQRSRPERIATKTSDKKAAQQQLDALLGDLAHGLPLNPRLNTLEFWQLAELVQADYENEGFRTAAITKRRFEMHVVPFFGPMIATQITSIEIDKYKTMRRTAGAAKATIRRELELVKRAFTLGARAWKIHGPHIALPKIQNAREGFFEQADFERVMAAMENADYRDVLLFAYVTGWRTGEIKNLRRRHIDFANHCIRLDPGTTKNGDGRVFPMLAGLDTMLVRRLKAPGFGNDPVFTYTLRGKAVPVGDFQKAFNTACYKAGIPCETEPWSFINPKNGAKVEGVRVLRCSRLPHDFRRTAVRNLTTMGVPDAIAMQMTGHKTRAVYDRYRIVSEADLQIAGGKMNAAFSGLMSRQAAGTVAGTVKAPRKRLG